MHSSFSTMSCISFCIRASSRLIYFSNVAVNVFIYAGRSNDFRVVFSNDWKAIKRFCCNRRQPMRSTPSTAVLVGTETSNIRHNSSSGSLCSRTLSTVSFDTIQNQLRIEGCSVVETVCERPGPHESTHL